MDSLTKQEYYTEIDIARYIRQLLWGLEYIHGNHYAHLGLTVRCMKLVCLSKETFRMFLVMVNS